MSGPTSLDRTDIDLAAGQKGHRAAEIDGEAALDAAEDHSFNLLASALRFCSSRVQPSSRRALSR